MLTGSGPVSAPQRSGLNRRASASDTSDSAEMSARSSSLPLWSLRTCAYRWRIAPGRSVSAGDDLTPVAHAPGLRVPAAAHGCRPDRWSARCPLERPAALPARRRHRPSQPARATRLSAYRHRCPVLRFPHPPVPVRDWPACGHHARPDRQLRHSHAAASPAAGARAAEHPPPGHAGRWRPALRHRVPPSREIRARREAKPRCRCIELSLGEGTVLRLPGVQSRTEQLVPEPVGRRLAEPG